jgi:hypothetical protein
MTIDIIHNWQLTIDGTQIRQMMTTTAGCLDPSFQKNRAKQGVLFDLKMIIRRSNGKVSRQLN